jgi:hypothetical protein
MGNSDRKFTIDSVRILKLAREDAAIKELHASSDLRMLLSFLDRFDRLGWIPPSDPEKQQLLAANDVTMHRVSDTVWFYEFCSKGARGERDPWISIFFHIHLPDWCVRICGVEYFSTNRGTRSSLLRRVRRRVETLDRLLLRKSTER